MVARYYDPATGTFLTRDPLEALTGAPYSYAGEDPIDNSDPSGLCNKNPFSSGFWTDGNCISEAVDNHGGDAATGAAAAACVAAFFDFGVTSAGCAYITALAFAARVNQRRATDGWCGSWALDIADALITTATLGTGSLLERGLASIEAGASNVLQLVKLGFSLRGAVAEAVAELINGLGDAQSKDQSS